MGENLIKSASFSSAFYFAYAKRNNGEIVPLFCTNGLVASQNLRSVRSSITKAKQLAKNVENSSYLIYKVTKSGLSTPVVEFIEEY